MLARLEASNDTVAQEAQWCGDVVEGAVEVLPHQDFGIQTQLPQ